VTLCVPLWLKIDGGSWFPILLYCWTVKKLAWHQKLNRYPSCWLCNLWFVCNLYFLQAAQTPLQLPQSLLQAAQTLLQVAQTLLQAAQTLLQVAQALLQVAQTLLQAAQILLQATQTLLQAAQTLLQVAQAPLQLPQSLLQAAQALLQVAQALLQLTRLSLQFAEAFPGLPRRSCVLFKRKGKIKKQTRVELEEWGQVFYFFTKRFLVVEDIIILFLPGTIPFISMGIMRKFHQYG
jgi:hypothetical protein